MNDRELNTILAALRYFQQNWNAALAGNSGLLGGGPILNVGEIDNLCTKLNSAQPNEEGPRMTAITREQFEGLRRYLHDDCQVHLAAHGKWHPDAGKLGAALESVGIAVESCHSPGTGTQPRVIVVVEGGNVQSICADRPLNVDVLDHDNWDGTDQASDPQEWRRFEALAKEIDEGRLLEQID